jgi:hypothetical protein
VKEDLWFILFQNTNRFTSRTTHGNFLIGINSKPQTGVKPAKVRDKWFKLLAISIINHSAMKARIFLFLIDKHNFLII